MGMGADFDISLVVLQLEKMMAGGIPTLDENAKIPKNQIDLIASDVGAIADDGDAVLSSLNTATGTISSSILPSYVDDVLNFANLAAFPVAGESGKIYVTENDNKTYRWTGTVYVEISSSSIPSWGDITGKPSPIEYLSSNPNPPNYNYWLFGNFYGQYWELIPVSQNPGNNTVALRTATGGVAGTTLSATSTTQSTSPTTGASVIAGGQGIGGDQFVGGNTNANGFYSINGYGYWVDGIQVVGRRKPGWFPPTGTGTKSAFATSTVTLPQLAERVKALIDDLTAHGLIGA